ncbi:MAG: ATPase, T2SS/T4P/T4SS family [Victivallales bacterium]|nr:ATPase, T2SS/T4P/T4SS family [Victivallales bacterium]
MELKMDHSAPVFEEKLEAIRNALGKRFSDYGKLRRSHSTAHDADNILCEKGLISETDLLSIYTETLAIKPFDENDFIEPDKHEFISVDYITVNCCLPYIWDEGSMIMLVCEPYRLQHHFYVFRRFFNLELSFYFVRRSILERMINRIYIDRKTAEANSLELLDGDENTLRTLASEAKIVRLINEMLSQALEQSASDIHIEPEEERVVTRFRVDGILREYLSCALNDYPAIASRIKLIGGLNIAESRRPQDGRTNFRVGNFDMDIRISTIPIMNGESIVLRILRKDVMAFDLEKLGMSKTLHCRFDKLISIPHGIILVVGPTGSGKTTTLYSVMRQLNNNSRKIITIEDPVEYQLQGLSQMQVNPRIGLTFASGLRHIVRQDPDVILVGEIRDRETAEIAINAALTGHLVLSTLHTNDAAGAVTRLLDMGVESFLVASALFGVLSQRLVRVVCPECRGQSDNDGKRCKLCGGSGFKGRTGIYELLIVDEKIRQAITGNSSSSEIKEIAVRNGMIPLLQDGLSKVAAGTTLESEVRRSASDS